MATRNSRAAPVKWPHPGGEAPSTGAPSTGGAGGRLGAALDTALPGVSSLKSSTSAGRTNPAAGTARRAASDARGGASGDRSPSQRLARGAGVDHSRGGGGGGGGSGQLGQTSGQQDGLPAAGRDARRVENSAGCVARRVVNSFHRRTSGRVRRCGREELLSGAVLDFANLNRVSTWSSTVSVRRWRRQDRDQSLVA